MKRKFSEINKSFDTTDKTKKLFIKIPKYLLCDVCSIPVYFYEYCIGNDVYCGRDCYEVLQLSKKNNYLDTNDKKDFMQIDN